MALLNCKECDKQVSTQAKRCPNCGAKAPKKPCPKWAVVINLIVWPLLIYSCTQISQVELTPAEKVERIMRHVAYQCGYSVKSTLNDPDSAKFDYDNAEVIPEITKNNAVWLVRVPVRAKNAFNATISAVYQCRVKSTGDDTWETLKVSRIS